MKLTKRQREIYDYIRSFLETNGYAPSLEEIGAHFGLTSVATVHEHLSNLEAKGALRRDAHRSRALELTHPRVATAALLPLLGRVAAGSPIEAVADDETLAVPEHLLGRGETFVLQVAGDSMIDEHIQDGDFLVVERRDTARPGERVIALIDGESATLKTFHQETDGTVRLEPANPAHETQRYAADRVRIQGVAIGVLRKYR
ncbi:MAG TPA: transcriptional repressor LexA [Gemmatimonadota bacterium]|jgi:repressor LexA|nr:transcriptional repressor LexA [Gemmatimonadota bacterium]